MFSTPSKHPTHLQEHIKIRLSFILLPLTPAFNLTHLRAGYDVCHLTLASSVSQAIGIAAGSASLYSSVLLGGACFRSFFRSLFLSSKKIKILALIHASSNKPHLMVPFNPPPSILPQWCCSYVFSASIAHPETKTTASSPWYVILYPT